MNFSRHRGKVVQHLLVIAASFLVMKPSLARADDGTKGSGSSHRLIFGAGFGEDWAHRSDYGEIWVPTPSARAMYLYRPVNHFDVGADACLSFWTKGPGTIFVPRVAARGFVPVTSSDGVVELGFTLGAGASIGNYNG